MLIRFPSAAPCLQDIFSQATMDGGEKCVRFLYEGVEVRRRAVCEYPDHV